ARDPAFAVVVRAGMIADAAMNYGMTATPLALAACGHAFPATKVTMQAHVLGMFVPSFFTGPLIRRFGLLQVMLAGTALIAACIAVNATGVSELHFNAALLLLGVGWNFLYVGASTLLTEVPAPSERNKVQAANDFMVFGLVSVSAWSSGAMHEWLGWQPANYVVVPLVAAAALATLWLMHKRRALAPAT
ncbi:MAG: MFS transporter, partial [Rhodospirillales bacterium]